MDTCTPQKMMSAKEGTFGTDKETGTSFQSQEKSLFKLNIPDEMALASYCKDHYFEYHERSGWHLKNNAPPFLRNIKNQMDPSDPRSGEHLKNRGDGAQKTNELYKIVTHVAIGLHRSHPEDERLEKTADGFRKQLQVNRKMNQLDSFLSKRQGMVKQPPQRDHRQERSTGLHRTLDTR